MRHRSKLFANLFVWLLTSSRCLAPSEAGVAVVFSYYAAAEDGGRRCPSEFREVSEAVSKIHCASLCMQSACKGYALQKGKCAISGSLAAPSIGANSMRFRRVNYLSSTINIARGKTTTSVKHWTSPKDLVGDLAVDGDDSSSSYFHSDPYTDNPWWVLDLGDNHLVKEVHVMPDGSGIHARQFTEVEIRIGKEPVSNEVFSSWDLLVFYTGPPTGVREYLKFSADDSIPGLCGRYVSIQKIGATPNIYFAFNEVKVFALEDDM
ncbi:uncharacterized protein [Palaemon carinicauda]|uniref:uncharacterized protein n=1 Tax=Palaemon carinicauda TaxID=392227 RepID=UPI0035B68775